jgi:hypothetical protein
MGGPGALRHDPLDEVMLRWCTARLRAHLVISGHVEHIDEESFLEVYRAAHDVPSLVARLREYEGRPE